MQIIKYLHEVMLGTADRFSVRDGLVGGDARRDAVLPPVLAHRPGQLSLEADGQVVQAEGDNRHVVREDVASAECLSVTGS